MTDRYTIDLFDEADDSGAQGAHVESDPAPVEEPTVAPATPATKRKGPRVWTVRQVNQAVRLLLEDNVPPVWIVGEVAGWTRARSGHCYFTLKDDAAQLQCVLFKSDAERLTTDPSEGDRVRVYGGLTLYEARGDYQMVARRVEAEDGEGQWKKAFEQLRKKLEAEGLTAPDRKRRLPALPTTVGIVTSTSGAALRDILAGLRTRAPWVHVVVRNTRVQGEGSSRSIAQAIHTLANSGRVEVLIVGRGGGSVEDLWAFNEEPVARAIIESPIPVISAVGHEVDVTISDLVADARAPTPTAAAALVVQAASRRLDALSTLRPRFRRALQGKIDRMVLRRDQAAGRSERAVTRTIERKRGRLQTAAGRLHALSPLRTLDRGYAVALDADGRVARSTAALPTGTEFSVRLPDGTVAAQSLGPKK